MEEVKDGEIVRSIQYSRIVSSPQGSVFRRLDRPCSTLTTRLAQAFSVQVPPSAED